MEGRHTVFFYRLMLPTMRAAVLTGQLAGKGGLKINLKLATTIWASRY